MVNNAAKLIAKLFQCRVKMSATSLIAKCDPASKSNMPLKIYADPPAEVIWKHLDTYFKHDRAAASPRGFKEFIVASQNAGNLSHCAEQIIEMLFTEKVQQIVANERASLMKKVQGESCGDGSPMTDSTNLEM